MKLLLFVTSLLLSLGIMAQSYNDGYYDGIGNYGGVTITSKQKEEIIKIKKGIGKRHAAIGRSGLRGPEMGQAHRDLNLEIRKEIRAVLNADQNADWDKYRSGYSYDYRGNSREIDAIEDKIDALENEYERRIDLVEDDYSLPKRERKYRKQVLKDEMKAQKRELKREKQRLKDQWN